MTAPEREIITCVCCGKHGPRAGRGLIRVCYMRHRRAGTLEQFETHRTPNVEGCQIDECACCGTTGIINARGLIRTCYARHHQAGTLDQFPAGAYQSRRAEEARLQREEFARLRKGGVAVVEAGARIGVSSSTAWRYETALIEDGWCPPHRRSRRSPEEIDQLRAALLAHLDRYPALSFSVWDLQRVVVHPLEEGRRTVQNLLWRLASDGLVEVVDGQRDPQSPRVPTRRYRSRAGTSPGLAQTVLREAS